MKTSYICLHCFFICSR